MAGVLQNLDPPQPCSFLQPGQTFTGSQRVSRSQTSLQEDWSVVVTVQVGLTPELCVVPGFAST